jgi:hypothetical protein
MGTTDTTEKAGTTEMKERKWPLTCLPGKGRFEEVEKKFH